MNPITLPQPKHILTATDLTHHGMNDPNYLARRKTITAVATKLRQEPFTQVPNITYTKQEEATWQTIADELEQLHNQHANSQYLKAKQQLQISTDRIPQMQELSEVTQKATCMRLAPIEGLVDSRTFLSLLAKKIMLSTQYIRHHDDPFFTPEPDIVHEYFGHVPTFLDTNIVEMSMQIGRAAAEANERQLQMIERLYWFTLEYGLVEEKNTPKLFGAGLLAGIADMKQALGEHAVIHPFTLEQVFESDYNFDVMQPEYFIVSSFEDLQKQVQGFLKKENLIS